MDLTSPGGLIGERQHEEERIFGILFPALRRFIGKTVTEGGQALDSPVLLASADPFAFTNVMGRWYTAIRELSSNRELADYPVREVLESSALPSDLFGDVAEILRMSRRDNWTQYRTKWHLSRTLIPKQNLRAGEERGGYRARIRRLARTMATQGFSERVFRELSEEGYTAKRWASRHDPRTRHSHLQADGQTVGIGQRFRVGGTLLMYPADPAGPISETANCRCLVVGVGPRRKD